MHVDNLATEKLKLRVTSGAQRPLLCPRCVSFTMHERHRNGVTIDVCQLCGGVWLDPGELERLTAVRAAGPEAEVADHWGFVRRLAIARGDYDDG